MDDKIHYETNVPPLRIYSVTWNVHAMNPGDINIMSLLSPLWKQASEEDRVPDVFYFGFQEIVEMTAQQILSTDLNRRLLWEQQLMTVLDSAFGEKYYRLLTSVNLVGILLVVVVKSDLLPFFRRVECFSRKVCSDRLLVYSYLIFMSF